MYHNCFKQLHNMNKLRSKWKIFDTHSKGFAEAFQMSRWLSIKQWFQKWVTTVFDRFTLPRFIPNKEYVPGSFVWRVLDPETSRVTFRVLKKEGEQIIWKK